MMNIEIVSQRRREYLRKARHNLHIMEINVYQELSYLISSNCAQCRQSITGDKRLTAVCDLIIGAAAKCPMRCQNACYFSSLG